MCATGTTGTIIIRDHSGTTVTTIVTGMTDLSARLPALDLPDPGRLQGQTSPLGAGTSGVRALPCVLSHRDLSERVRICTPEQRGQRGWHTRGSRSLQV